MGKKCRGSKFPIMHCPATHPSLTHTLINSNGRQTHSNTMVSNRRYCRHHIIGSLGNCLNTTFVYQDLAGNDPNVVENLASINNPQDLSSEEVCLIQRRLFLSSNQPIHRCYGSAGSLTSSHYLSQSVIHGKPY